MRTEILNGFAYMSDSQEGNFSANLLSLQLQLKTLLDGAGGDSTIKFLDLLSTLNPSEQKLALAAFSAVLDKIRSGQERLFTEEDRNLKEFEDSLYREILGSMRDVANNSEPKRIEVLDGGKSRSPFAKAAVSKTPIDFSAARRNRRAKPKPLLN